MLEILGTACACLAAADLIVGVVHWAEDTYCGSAPWQRWQGRARSLQARAVAVMRRGVCDPNQNHHQQPLAMGDSVWNRSGLPLTAAALAIVASVASGWGGWPLWLTAAIAGGGNEVHHWSHARPPRWARLLQDMHLVQTPQQHARHHRGAHDTHYCTLTNWLNPLLDGSGLWRGLEWLIEALAGVPPVRVLPTAAADADDGAPPADEAARLERVRRRFPVLRRLKRREQNHIHEAVERAVARAAAAGVTDETELTVLAVAEVRSDVRCGGLLVWIGWQALAALVQYLVREWLERRKRS